MKGKKPLSKIPKEISLKTSTSNLFLNIIIILLALVVAFMVYSLYRNVKSNNLNEESLEKKNKTANIIQVEVLNGCGKSGVAEKFTSYLRNRNFDVVQMGNYISFDIDKTMVIDRTGNKANAEKVAEAIGVDKKNVIQQLNKEYFLDVSIIIGKDFNQLNPLK